MRTCGNTLEYKLVFELQHCASPKTIWICDFFAHSANCQVPLWCSLPPRSTRKILCLLIPDVYSRGVVNVSLFFVGSSPSEMLANLLLLRKIAVYLIYSRVRASLSTLALIAIELIIACSTSTFHASLALAWWQFYFFSFFVNVERHICFLDCGKCFLTNNPVVVLRFWMNIYIDTETLFLQYCGEKDSLHRHILYMHCQVKKWENELGESVAKKKGGGIYLFYKSFKNWSWGCVCPKQNPKEVYVACVKHIRIYNIRI